MGGSVPLTTPLANDSHDYDFHYEQIFIYSLFCIESMRSSKLVLWFDELSIADVPLVGGKNASLGEMYRELTNKGLRVPNGFAITASAYRYLLATSGAEELLREALRGLDVHDQKELARVGARCREIIGNAKFPVPLKNEIATAYKKLCSFAKIHEIDVAVRSSATAEDLPDASFAGQQETYLNIVGEKALLSACKNCFASLFTNRAIAYRAEKKFDHFSVALSIGVQIMVRSDLACSGVMFTLDTETGFRDVVFITAGYGLGENIVQGAINPDEYYVFKPTLRAGKKPIISKTLGEKSLRMIYGNEKKPTRNILVLEQERKKFALTEDEVLELATYGVTIEDHYTKKRKMWTPMDIEWAKDGRTEKLFIVQARPETVQSRKNKNLIEEYSLNKNGKNATVICKGKSVGSKIGQGKAHIIHDIKDMNIFKQGEVLVTDMTNPDWVPIMKIASAIVTNRGGRTCHAAIVSRELGIPCVVGTNNGTQAIKQGQNITVSCAEGEEGTVYDGLLPFTVNKIELTTLKKLPVKIMMNVGNPDEAFELSFLPNDGVGLARMEFIVTDFIKVHPLALIHYNKIKEPEVRKKIDLLTQGYSDRTHYFIDKLSQGIATLAAAFYPKDVILRFSDFKTNEYATLLGGHQFEPKEDNPMIGWRGASRYYSESYGPGFALECAAVKKVREEMGLTNLKVMIPFCRTVEEGKKVIAAMRTNGLVQGKNDLHVYVMCEIPSNVILAEEFCKIFDGFSIGSNDLTQLTLGVDRDSELVANVYDERNLAVERLIQTVIRIAKKNHRKIGICGQAPSDHPDFAKFLINEKIDSISLNPDSVLKAIRLFGK